ncbi:hypothetical protein SOVF_208680 [Spinacia oleracea]|nr:hypothetical protein SOVF_208680 [Spinacia oleracea]
MLQVSRPYKQAEFDIIFGEGASKLMSAFWMDSAVIFYSFYSVIREDISGQE